MLEFLFVGLIINVIIVLCFVFGVKQSYKISKAKCAHDYLEQNSISYRQKSDTYIRTYVTKVRIQSNNSNRGGGVNN